METVKNGTFGCLEVSVDVGFFLRFQRFPELFQPLTTLQKKCVNVVTIK